MNQYKENSIIKFLATVLVVVLITPTFVKLSHVFSGHEHVVCSSQQTKHLHERDLDCDFYKFKLSQEFTFIGYDNEVILSPIVQLLIESNYNAVDNHEELHFSLRGPPSIV